MENIKPTGPVVARINSIAEELASVEFARQMSALGEERRAALATLHRWIGTPKTDADLKEEVMKNPLIWIAAILTYLEEAGPKI